MSIITLGLFLYWIHNVQYIQSYLGQTAVPLCKQSSTDVHVDFNVKNLFVILFFFLFNFEFLIKESEFFVMELMKFL